MLGVVREMGEVRGGTRGDKEVVVISSDGVVGRRCRSPARSGARIGNQKSLACTLLGQGGWPAEMMMVSDGRGRGVVLRLSEVRGRRCENVERELGWWSGGGVVGRGRTC
ncbi:hypothetical protein Acr_29g0005390 [Actinidia rufa]|uniref:Uncharacterized protein n=1 Tax=Actinidia rufa TaxID=165716 RepID=A0A7J0HE21_9ERIC|nr:hypothetical protein Acr_29g0005390 [Actinidia rufa]